jgi:hypothetical protein
MRKAKFNNVDFTGSFFTDCNLEKASFQAVQLRYVRFLRCILNYREILQSLPVEPIIAISLLKALRQNATMMGSNEVGDAILLQEIKLETHEFKNQFLGVSTYYKDRYKNFDKLKSFLLFLCNKISEFCWGYGIKLRSLFRSALLIVVLFAFIFYLGTFKFCDSSPISLGVWDSLYFSIVTFTTLGHPLYAPISLFCQAACAIESFLGVLFLGFFAASVYRKFSR